MNEGNVHENAVVFGCNWLQRDRGEGMAGGHKQWLPQGLAPNYRGYPRVLPPIIVVTHKLKTRISNSRLLLLCVI